MGSAHVVLPLYDGHKTSPMRKMWISSWRCGLNKYPPHYTHKEKNSDYLVQGILIAQTILLKNWSKNLSTFESTQCCINVWAKLSIFSTPKLNKFIFSILSLKHVAVPDPDSFLAMPLVQVDWDIFRINRWDFGRCFKMGLSSMSTQSTRVALLIGTRKCKPSRDDTWLSVHYSALRRLCHPELTLAYMCIICYH